MQSTHFTLGVQTDWGVLVGAGGGGGGVVEFEGEGLTTEPALLSRPRPS